MFLKQGNFSVCYQVLHYNLSWKLDLGIDIKMIFKINLMTGLKRGFSFKTLAVQDEDLGLDAM